MKAINLVLIFYIIAVLSATSYGRTRVSSEIAGLIGLIGKVNTYAAYNDGDLPNSWIDILTAHGFDTYLYDQLLLPVGKDRNLTELYSFLTPDDRKKFPDGELILVRYSPVSTEEQSTRSFIYRNSNGRVKGETWDEERFQAMLAETGITVPPPQPLPPEPPVPAENQQQLEPQPQPEAPQPESAEEQSVLPDGADLPASPENQPSQPDSEQKAEDGGNRTFLWLAGTLLLALLVAAAVLRARKRDAPSN